MLLGRQRSPQAASGPNQTPYLRVANVFDSSIDYSDVLSMSFSPAERRIFYLQPGDILLNEGQSLELVGRSAIYDGPPDVYCFQNTLVRFRCGPDVVPRFAQAVFKHWLDTRHFARIARQTTSIAHLGADRFARLAFPMPRLSEQRLIVAVLDALDEAVRKTEQVIAKLQRVKQGLLNDLLTRGIDDNGELRDPERHPKKFKATHRGALPVKWEVAPLRTRLARIEAGSSPDLADSPAPPGEWGVLKVGAVWPDGFRPYENKAVHDLRIVDPSVEVHDGDLILSRANTYELVGLVCLVRNPPARLLLCDKTLRLHPSEDVDSEFLSFAFQSSPVRRQIEATATGTSGSMKNISQNSILGLEFVFPEMVEQQRIAAVLHAQVQRVRDETSALGKLRLLKRGVMGDLLTGGVRVEALSEA